MAGSSEQDTVLAVDDDHLVLRALEATLKRHFRVLTADSGAAALALLAEHPSAAVAIIDQRMPGMSGAELIRHLAEPYPNLVRIILTGYQDIESLKQAINNGGAFRYLEKPCSNEDLLSAVRQAIALHRRLRDGAAVPAALENEALRRSNQRLQLENLHLRMEVEQSLVLGAPIVGSSPVLRQVLAEADRMAATDTTVLILGETGTGKELLARRLHERSGRRDRTFRAQNCGAIVEQLAEDMLFGHVAGAFTGAGASRKGLFEIADGGTLFLDEIGECSPSLQARLLRVVEERTVHRLGDDEHPHPIDVRLIAATHRDLLAEVRAARFREDLYYRLNVFCLRVPPLRERRSDIAELAQYFVTRFNDRARSLSGKLVQGLDAEAVSTLERYDYPGNIRELANIVERAWLFADDGGAIAAEHVRLTEVTGTNASPVPTTSTAECQPLRDAIAEFKVRHIATALERHDWNVAATARALGVSRGRLYEEMRDCGLQRPPD